MTARADLEQRAAGALWALAIGDALGMPTQLLSPAAIAARYGTVGGFLAPAADHPIAAGLRAGTVTDDTEQAVLLGRLLGPGGRLDERTWADALAAWEHQAQARGSADLLGPSTKAALEALRRGTDVSQTGRAGTTNGAAMRIAPVGIAVPPDDLDVLVDRVVEASRLTHSTSVALAGACAVAAAVSAGVAGAEAADQHALAVRAADLGAARGRWVAGASVGRRIEEALSGLAGLSESSLLPWVAAVVGTSLATQESVPAAFAFAAAYADRPWEALCQAASVGGDCDTIAAMAGAVVGSRCGRAGLPADAIDVVRSVNGPRLDGLDLDDLARRLVDLRCASS